MDKIYLGNKIENFEHSEPFLPISRIILKVDGQNGFVAGDDSGRTIEKTMSWATQEMADSILATLKGQVYKPFSGTGAFLDPAAELGDALTVAGNYGILAGMSRQLDRMGIADIFAPGADELEDEFSYTPKSQREIDRALGKAYSRITKTAEQIRLDVAKDLENYSTIQQTSSAIESAVNSVNQSVDGKLENYSTIKQTADSISTAVTSVNQSVDGKLENYSTIKQTANSISAAVSGLVNGSQVDSKITAALNRIELSVSNGSTSSTIKLMSGATELSSQTIQMNGLVTFSSLTESGKTSINGANIQTGTITASKIDASELKVDAANITGTLAIGKLPDTVAQKNDIPTKLSAFTNDEGFQGKSGITTIIDGRVTADYIEALDISARKLKGEKIYLRDDDGNLVSTFTLNAADTADYKLDIEADALAIVTSPGNLYLAQGEGNCFIMIRPGNIRTNGPILPATDDSDWLGSGSKRWTDIYAVNGTIQTSDRAKKKDINYDLSRYDALFNALAPCTFRFTDSHDRIHIGMISQDVEERMEQCGIDSMELAAFIKSPDENGGYRYGLRYSEFISLLIDQVQKLKKRIKKLEEAA